MAMAKAASKMLPCGLLASRRLSVETMLVDSMAVAETATLPEFKPLYRRLSGLGATPGGSVAEILKEWQSEGKRVTESQLLNFVRQLRRYKSYKTALELMDWMEGQQLGGNHAVRIDLLSKLKGIGMAEEYFYSIPETAKNHQTYGALLSCYCSEKLKDKAISIHNRMKELGLASSALAYNNVMSLYMKSGQPEEVRRLFDEMKATKTFPDKCSYKILIESYALLNDLDSIESIVQEMEVKEGAWHWSLYCHLAAIYNSAKHFEKARIALKKAELMMNGRDSSPFPFLISLYAAAGDLLEAKRVWASLNARIQKSRFPTNKEYLVLLQALKKLHDVAALKVLFEEWESNCVSYDMKLVNAVIGAYLEKHMVEEAIQLLEKAMEEGAHLVLKSFWLFIDHYIKKGEKDQARRWSVAASSLVKRGHSGGLELLRMIT
ncbi:Pentatricopeptide repeat-containing protein [Dendrobium catenatum]|uniref:Pentatricopeptide repeat-containing protein n=1 Tax=Dendrobium catenatum TaxID=906689 RepID=A0A2I0WYV5_9ASPA|nr:Pentatricopeptide repeat-containing protein [Dendrobium catenatum]